MNRFTRPQHVRRGAAVAAVVVLLALLNFVVLGGIEPVRDESAMAIDRLQAARSLHAAESGVRIALRLTLSGRDLPDSGETRMLGPAEIEFINVPPPGGGEIVVEGRSGPCRRTMSAVVY